MAMQKRQQHTHQSSGVIWLESNHTNKGLKVEYLNNGKKETTASSNNTGDPSRKMMAICSNDTSSERKCTVGTQWYAGFLQGMPFL